MKFVFVIAGLCGVALAGGNDQGRNQDWGQHDSQVQNQHNAFSGDAQGGDGRDGRGNNDQAWHAGSNSDHTGQDHRQGGGFIPIVNQNDGYVSQPTYQQTYQTGYVAPTGYVVAQQSYPNQQTYSNGYVDQQNYQTGYPTPFPTPVPTPVPVVDPNQFDNGYYSDQSGNVYQYQNNGFYNYGPTTVDSQTYSFIPVTIDQVGTYANQQGFSFHRFGSNDEAKKFNDQYRNRSRGNDHGNGNDQHNDHGNQGNQGNDHGNNHGNNHGTAYGVDVGSNLRRDGGRNDHP